MLPLRLTMLLPEALFLPLRVYRRLRRYACRLLRRDLHCRHVVSAALRSDAAYTPPNICAIIF